MRASPRFLSTLFLTAGLPLWAAPMQKAEVTRIHNEVKILPGSGDSKEAKPGDIIEGKTAVRTGDKSRAELKFTDDTLTRLGANSQFSFESGTRNLSLDNGVLFLQVPKGAGGAKIKTAAVTAAVTGTTIMMEYVEGKILKIIVIEGTLDVYYPDRPGEFITLKAGQMIMMRPGAMGFPRPVEVDIDKLLETSDLAGGNGEIFDPVGGDAGDAIQDAINKQLQDLKDGKLIGTNLVLPGRGNQVVLLTGDAALALRAGDFGNPPPSGPLNGGDPPPDGAPPPPPQGDPRYLPPPLLSGNWRINETMNVAPDVPSITQGAQTGEGGIYLPGSSGPLHTWLFGTANTVPGTGLAEFLDQTGPWSAYLLSSVSLEGTPVIGPNGPQNILFASPTTIGIVPGAAEQSRTWSLDGVGNWGLFTQGGSIDLRDPFFTVSGTNSNLAIHANGTTANVDLGNIFSLGEGSLATFSGGDTNLRFGTAIAGMDFKANAAGRVDMDLAKASVGRDLEIQSGKGIRITDSTLEAGPAQTNIQITNSTDLANLVNASGTGGRVKISTSTGDIQINGGTLIQANGDGSRVDILALEGPVSIQGDVQNEAYAHITAVDTVRVESLGGATPRVSIFGGILSANNIIVQATGTNSLVDINGSEILAGQSARLYAEGPGSVLQLGGYTRLTGQVVRLAGETVRVPTNGFVDATAVGRLGIHADNHEYRFPGQIGNSWGFISTGANTEVIKTNYAGRNDPLPAPPP